MPPWNAATVGSVSPGPMISRLQRRLLVMLLLPLCLLVLVNAWFNYRSADSAALQKDRQLLQLLPLLEGSIVAPGRELGDAPVLLMAPPIEEFLNRRVGDAAYAITDLGGRSLHGALWLAGILPTTDEAEFHSQEEGGTTYRVAAQQVHTVAGDFVVLLADGSDPRLKWTRAVLLRVLLPNLVLIIAGAFAANWAVRRALRPLTELIDTVEHRLPQDLSPIDEQASPDEVRPLVRALNRLFGMVHAQAESQRRFVADAAHQLRTPLAGLQAQVEAWAHAASAPASGAQGKEPAPPGAIVLRADQIHQLRSATRRTSQLASQLLALSRADARNLEAQPMQRVDLKDLCETLLQTHLDAAMARQIDLGLDAQPAHVMGHDWLLRELLGNLVDNAVKYTPEGGSVTIRCGWSPGVEGAAPFLEVEDDGPGLEPAERARVLERFYRVPGTRGEGSGLGLAIADEIARGHRSQLDIMSGAAGRGLRVRLVFAP